MLKLNHKRFEVWQVSIEFVTDIYRITNGFPKIELYGLANQMRRAAISIPSNISEGSARRTPADRRRFYELARSSVSELDTQLEIALRLGYYKKSNTIIERINHLFALLSNLIVKTV